MRPTSGLALFAYEVLSSMESIQLPGSHSEDKNTSSVLTNGNGKQGFGDSSRAAKVFQMKGASSTANANSSEVRRPAAICMSVGFSISSSSMSVEGACRQHIARHTSSVFSWPSSSRLPYSLFYSFLPIHYRAHPFPVSCLLAWSLYRRMLCVDI